MFEYDDRWILEKPLDICEYVLREPNGVHVTHYGCVVKHATFYEDILLRHLVIDCQTVTNFLDTKFPYIFIQQHGQPLENITYLGIAEKHKEMYRFFRVASMFGVYNDFLMTSITMNLAGIFSGAPTNIVDELYVK